MWEMRQSHKFDHQSPLSSVLKRRLIKLMAVFTILAVPAAILVWQTNTSAIDGSSATNTGANNSADTTGGSTMSEQTTDASTGSNDNQAASHHASTNISQHTSVNSNGTQSSTTVQINGKTVKMPSDGQLHRTYSDDNGTSQVDISVNGSGSSISNNSSSVNVQVNNDSTTGSE